MKVVLLWQCIIFSVIIIKYFQTYLLKNETCIEVSLSNEAIFSHMLLFHQMSFKKKILFIY